MKLGRLLSLVVLILAAAPLVFAGGAKNGGLTPPTGGGVQGSVKLKYDRAGAVQLFEVQIRKLAAGTWHVFVDGNEAGQIVLTEDGSAGKYKYNSKRGDAWPLADTDPAGATVEIRADDLVAVALEGTVPDPKIRK
jgi:hypothetical protein